MVDKELEPKDSSKKAPESLMDQLVSSGIAGLGALLLVGFCFVVALAGGMSSGSGGDRFISDLMCASPLLLALVLGAIVIFKRTRRRKG